MDHVYGNFDCSQDPAEDSSVLSWHPPCVAPHTSTGENKVSSPRKAVLLALVLGFGLLFTLTALVAVAYLYINEQTKFHQIEKLHRNLSTLNYSVLMAAVEDLRTEKLLTLQKPFDVPSGCRVCPDGWKHHSGKCYYFSSKRKNWKESQDHCCTLGGHLAIVSNQEEQNFLTQSITEDYYWIGMNDLETEAHWVWVDNTPLNKTRKVFWAQSLNGHEPDNWKVQDPNGENCGLISHLGDWLDNSCKIRWAFICETIATDWAG